MRQLLLLPWQQLWPMMAVAVAASFAVAVVVWKSQTLEAALVVADFLV
jgi:hypothetical protein